MARFLSPEWLEEASALAARDEGLRRAAADAELTVQQVVLGDEGELCYCLRFDHGVVRLTPGPAETPDVVIREGYCTAAALSRGELTPGEAMARGLVKVSGDVRVLVSHHDALPGLGDVFAALRPTTVY